VTQRKEGRAQWQDRTRDAPELTDLVLKRSPGRRSDRDITLFLNYTTRISIRGTGTSSIPRLASWTGRKIDTDLLTSACLIDNEDSPTAASQEAGSEGKASRGGDHVCFHERCPRLYIFGPACWGPFVRLLRTIFTRETITFVIASAPGGGYDTYSRLVPAISAATWRVKPVGRAATCQAQTASKRRCISILRAKGRTVIGLVMKPFSESILDPQKRKRDATSSIGSDVILRTARAVCRATPR